MSISGSNARLTGFELGFDGVGYCLYLVKKHWLWLDMNIGVNAGRLKLSSDDYGSQQNVFVSPKLHVAPAVKVGRFFASFSADYAYDVSHYNWKNLKSGALPFPSLGKLSQSGLLLMLKLGIYVA